MQWIDLSQDDFGVDVAFCISKQHFDIKRIPLLCS